MTDKSAKILWIVAIVVMGLTAAMNLLGGIGTVCAAFFTEDFPPLRKLLDYQWLYRRMMFITILIGIAGAWATIALFRGGRYVYRNALVILLIGTLVGDLHMNASLELRGKVVPANVKLYVNLFTLIFFLILGLPSLRGRIDFSRPGGKTEATAAGGFAAIVIGITLLTVGTWVGSSHSYQGTNWTDVLQPELSIGGAIFIVGGLIALTKALAVIIRQPEQIPLTNEAAP